MTSREGGKSSDAGDLNYDLNYNLFLLKMSMQNLKSAQDKHNVNRWVHKLRASNRSVAEMNVRNDFASLLVAAVQAGELRAPFDQHPPAEPLEAVAYLLSGGPPDAADRAAGRKDAAAWECRLTDEDADKPMLYRKSPDGGAFLATQPVPKRGAFCYLAVVGKPRSGDDVAFADAAADKAVDE